MSIDLCQKRTLLSSMIEREPDRLAARIQRIIRDEMTAEDLAQDAVLRALNGLGSVRAEAGEASLCAWLDRIARNTAYNHLRDQGRARKHLAPQPLDEEVAQSAPGAEPEAICAAAETRTLLFNLVRSLPDGIRQVFLLREMEGLATAETAAALAIGEGLVKWRLHRARQLLRTAIGPN